MPSLPPAASSGQPTSQEQFSCNLFFKNDCGRLHTGTDGESFMFVLSKLIFMRSLLMKIGTPVFCRADDLLELRVWFCVMGQMEDVRV